MNKIQKVITAIKKKKSYGGDPVRLKTSEPHKLYPEQLLKLINLLNYTRGRSVSYSASSFETGYHTLKIGEFELKGQRNPDQRFANVPFDFNGKSVLDIGCNQGGMLHAIADKISHGVGIDFDFKMVNAANKIKSYNQTAHLDFYNFDLDNEDYGYISDFLPDSRVDIIFLLSVCKWITRWKELITFCASISDYMLFETNGSAEVQQGQISYLKTVFKKVDIINEKSEDDLTQKDRILLLCSNAI